MIKLVVEEYCHECPNFEAHVEGPTIFDNGDVFGDTTIMCKKRVSCALAYKYGMAMKGENGDER